MAQHVPVLLTDDALLIFIGRPNCEAERRLNLKPDGSHALFSTQAGASHAILAPVCCQYTSSARRLSESQSTDIQPALLCVF